MRTKSKAYDLPDEISPETVLMSSRGSIFTVNRISDKEEEEPAAQNTLAPLLVFRAEKEERRKKRRSTKRFIPQYEVVHYWKGVPMAGSGLTLTIEKMRAMKIKILKLPIQNKLRVKNSLASKSLQELTGTREYER